jgi:hypothetical protein
LEDVDIDENIILKWLEMYVLNLCGSVNKVANFVFCKIRRTF